MRVILREARRSKDNGWLSYDRIFRQNAVTNPLVSWANLDPSLHASFCSQSGTVACALCNDVDHSEEECTTRPKEATTNTSTPSPIPARTAQSKRKICLSWNAGKCILPGTCEFLHICATCRDNHRACDCLQTASDSLFKRKRRRM